jgi:ribonuclease P protein component
VLIVHENQNEEVRVGIAAGRSLGMAVQRNRAKRMIRAAVHPLLNSLQPGSDLIWIARKPMLEASFPQIQEAMLTLLRRANLLNSNEG